MRIRGLATVAAIMAAASGMQGCAIIYVTEQSDPNGSVDRQYGLLGGCLPIWHYRSIKVKPVEEKAKTEPQAEEPAAMERPLPP
jgi:hypothetical protein